MGVCDCAFLARPFFCFFSDALRFLLCGFFLFLGDASGVTPAFDDASWIAGVIGVGYETGRGYEALIGTDVEEEMDDINASVYVRVPFDVAAGRRTSRGPGLVPEGWQERRSTPSRGARVAGPRNPPAQGAQPTTHGGAGRSPQVQPD